MIRTPEAVKAHQTMHTNKLTITTSRQQIESLIEIWNLHAFVQGDLVDGRFARVLPEACRYLETVLKSQKGETVSFEASPDGLRTLLIFACVPPVVLSDLRMAIIPVLSAWERRVSLGDLSAGPEEAEALELEEAAV